MCQNKIGLPRGKFKCTRRADFRYDDIAVCNTCGRIRIEMKTAMVGSSWEPFFIKAQDL